MTKKLIYIILFSFFPIIGYSQGNFKLADREYDRMRYAHAIEQYEIALKYEEPNLQVYKKLANSYYRVGDMKNAQRVYELYLKDTLSVAYKDADGIFEYAQSLAQNGQYELATEWYKRYHTLNGHNDSRGMDHHVAYKNNINEFYKDSLLYTLSRLNINSPQSDFSPVFYDKGIVFCSSRKMENGVRRVHSYNNAAFLDLYYVDTTFVNDKAYTTSKAAESYQHKTYSYLHANNELHSDETHYSSNDSYTVGYHAHVFKKKFEDTRTFEPKPFSDVINTKFHEGPATFNKEQNMIVFTRNNYNNGVAKKGEGNVNRLKLFVATKNSDQKWEKVTEFPYNSADYSVGHPTFAPDGKSIIFASNMPGGQGGTDLYRSTINNGKWSKPENLGSEINTEGNELFPFIDEQGILYFSSNGHPGLGGLDLFKVENGKIKHLSYPISSKKDDFGILVWSKGKKGFFSSNRDFGGFDDDLYMFTSNKIMMLAGKVYDEFRKKILPNSKVVLRDSTGNVVGETTTDSSGAYVMEVERENSYLVKGSKSTFYDTTTSFNTIGYKENLIKQDLYLANNLNVMLRGLITDRETGRAIENVHVRVTEDKTGKDLIEVHTGSQGTFEKLMETLKLKDSLNLHIHLAREGYLAKSVPYNSTVLDTVIRLHERLDIAMDKVKIGTDIGEILNLKPIYFNLAKWDIRSDAATELDKVVEIMLENPNMVIELGSHTDCRSSKAYNQSLSDKRAKSSAAYIVSKGIDQSRIYGKGYGESKPINQCECEGKRVVPCTEEEHQLNRRTEFIIIKM